MVSEDLWVSRDLGSRVMGVAELKVGSEMPIQGTGKSTSSLPVICFGVSD